MHSFQMIPRSMTLTLTFMLKIAFLDFVASGAEYFTNFFFLKPLTLYLKLRPMVPAGSFIIVIKHIGKLKNQKLN